MSQKSLGIIETIGLAAAVEAADAAVKSAAVELVGYELTKGSGMTVVKVEGNVGAVKAAIDAAAIASARVGTVVSTKVIARPSEQIGILVRNPDTVGWAEAGPKGPDNSGGAPDGPDGSGEPGGTDGSDTPGGVKSHRGPGRPPGSGRAQANTNAAAAGSSGPSALKRQESESETASETEAEAEAGAETETLAEALVQESLWPRMTSGPAENAAAWEPGTGLDGTAEADPAGVYSAEADSGLEFERESGLHTELNSEPGMEPDTELEPDLDSDPDSDSDLGPKPGSYTCNICKDPDCPRRKGDLKQLCIHYRKKNKG